MPSSGNGNNTGFFLAFGELFVENCVLGGGVGGGRGGGGESVSRVTYSRWPQRVGVVGGGVSKCESERQSESETGRGVKVWESERQSVREREGGREE